MNLSFLFMTLLFAKNEVAQQNEVKQNFEIGQGQLDDLKIELKSEEDFYKFERIQNMLKVPEGMAEVSKVIESFETDEIEEMKKGERFFVIYFVDAETALLPASHPDDGLMKVFISTDKDLAADMNTPFPGIYGFNPRDKLSYQFPLSEETMKTIIPIVSLNLMGMLTYQNIELYKSTGLHSYYVFIKPNEIDNFLTEFKPKASLLKHKGKFCLIPYKGDKSQLSVFDLTEEDLPGILFIHEGNKFPLKDCMNNDVAKFVEDALNNEIEPLFISQEAPENDEDNAVRTFTRNNLKDEKNKDKLVVFSSPSCNFCIQLRPVIEKLGALARDNFKDKLVVGSCDITLNDISDFDVSSVPRIYLIKGESGDAVRFESRERTLKSIASFIKESGTFNIDLTNFITDESEELEDPKSEIPAEKVSDIYQDGRDL